MYEVVNLVSKSQLNVTKMWLSRESRFLTRRERVSSPRSGNPRSSSPIFYLGLLSSSQFNYSIKLGLVK